MKTALTIAGSDCSGGAGIQADIKTMTMNGVYAMSVITALTAQNTCGVFGVQETSPDFLAMQLDAVFSDIRPDAIKIGMTSSSALIRVIADKLAFNKADNIGSSVKTASPRRACSGVGIDVIDTPGNEQVAGQGSHGLRIFGRIVEVRSTEQSVNQVLTPKSFYLLSDKAIS